MDTGLYPPKAFQSDKGEQRIVLAFVPKDEIPKDNGTAYSQEWTIRLEILVMINLIPFYEAMPVEAYGEEKLNTITTNITQFLTQLQNLTLNTNVNATRVASVKYDNMQRGKLSLRAACIKFEADVEVLRGLL